MGAREGGQAQPQCNWDIPLGTWPLGAGGEQTPELHVGAPDRTARQKSEFQRYLTKF